MVIYKITCLKNNKIYIGQTKNTSRRRFEHHVKGALTNDLDTHLARAIRKYGPENFILEDIDFAENQEDLTEKEYYWINFYESFKPDIGYNETNNKNKCGGNTYKFKSIEEMQKIKRKISKANSGSKNGMSKGVKCKNTKSGEEFHFGSTAECARFFGTYVTGFIRKRCCGYNYLYKNTWAFAWEDDQFLLEYENFDPSTRKGIKV